MKTKFKSLITGDAFRFVGESTVYMVCYNKQYIVGNNVIEELERPGHKQAITPGMMDMEVIRINDNEINYESNN